MKKYFAILPVLLLAACAPAGNNNALNVQVKNDEYSQLVEIDGPKSYENPVGGIFHEYWLQSFVHKDTHKVVHRLYVHFEYAKSRRIFFSASDNDAHYLPVTRLPNQGGGKGCQNDDNTYNCHVDETIFIDIKDAYLKKHQDTPYNIKVVSRAGDQIFLPISSLLVRIQLGVVAKYKSPNP